MGQATGVKADDLNLAIAAELPNPPVENSTSEVGLGGLVVSEHDGGAALGQELGMTAAEGGAEPSNRDGRASCVSPTKYCQEATVH